MTATERAAPPSYPQPVHDDRLISAALVSAYDELVLEGVLRTGQGKAAVIKGRIRWTRWSFEAESKTSTT